MNILPQKYLNVIKNVLEKALNTKINEIFDSLLNESTITNYLTIMEKTSEITDDISKNILITTFKAIDEMFMGSKYRKENFESHEKLERTITTIFGDITYKRRIYRDKNKKAGDDDYHVIYVDRYIGLPKRDRFDPYICSLVVG